MVFRLQPGKQFFKELLVFTNQLSFQSTFLAVTEEVEGCSTKEFESGKDLHRAENPGAIGGLDRFSGIRVPFGPQWWSEVDLQRIVSFELIFETFAEFRTGVHAGHFVFILVGQ